MRWVALVVLCACGRFGFDTTDADGATGDVYTATGDATVPATCNVLSRLYDDFEDGVLSDALWGASYTSSGSSLTEAQGELVLAPATNSAGQYVGLKSSWFYDLRGQRLIVEVTQVAAAGAISGIQIDPDTGDYVALVHEGGQLKAVTRLGSYELIDSIPYAPATHRFWAIREAAGVIYYETSADSVTFTAFAQVPTPFDVGLMRVSAYTGTQSAVASPGEMHVASLGLPSIAGAACSADTLVDTFDSTDDRLWRNAYTAAGLTQTRGGGVLQMTSDGSTAAASARSSAAYDLRGASFTVQLLQDPTVPNMVAALAARIDDNNVLTLGVSSTQTLARHEVGGSATSMAADRDPTEKWLRIREQGGSYFMEVSADRTTWHLLRSGAATFPVNDIGAVLRLEANATTSSDMVTWDNFNAP